MNGLRTGCGRLGVLVLLLSAMILTVGCAGNKKTAGMIVWENVGFETPESVLHDTVSDIYLVANINGGPVYEDGNGFISRISPEGGVLDLKWIDGTAEGVTLNAPKGMALQRHLLYVADITAVRLFDRESGEPVVSIEIPGTTFINDIAPGPNGSVYVSDSGLKLEEGQLLPSGTGAIYRIASDNTVETIAAGEELGGPNGVIMTEEGVIVVDFLGDAVFRIDARGEIAHITRAPTGGLDGVVLHPDGGLLFSSWEGSAIYRFTPDGEVKTVVSEVNAPADIGFDEKRMRVLIPLFNENKVVAYTVGN